MCTAAPTGPGKADVVNLSGWRCRSPRVLDQPRDEHTLNTAVTRVEEYTLLAFLCGRYLSWDASAQIALIKIWLAEKMELTVPEVSNCNRCSQRAARCMHGTTGCSKST